ncbi:MAG: DUF721 domain-containing protein [Fimbriimonadaceae bacterium]|nr:DUF721 domain-containing protein [Fimbriimonadaceae bacterium]
MSRILDELGRHPDLQRGRNVEAVSGHLEQVLGPVLFGRLRVKGHDRDTLLLAAVSPVWAQEARLHSDAILARANAVFPGPGFVGIRVSVDPFAPEGEDAKRI